MSLDTPFLNSAKLRHFGTVTLVSDVCSLLQGGANNLEFSLQALAEAWRIEDAFSQVTLYFDYACQSVMPAAR